ncbi:MAG: 2-amino-4-hydroxy-6-hydroxymethyldihydropteridine diphosphokinase [Anaerolineales bacterium]
MPEKILLGLGSNLGNRLKNLESAIAALPAHIAVTGRSSVYETPPWGYADQNNFYNMVVEAETEFSPPELLRELKAVEKKLGRTPSFKYGPREIDIDILLYGDSSISEADLTIPHPRIAERAFILVPMADLAPDLKIPGLNRTVTELLQTLDTSGITRVNP